MGADIEVAEQPAEEQENTTVVTQSTLSYTGIIVSAIILLLALTSDKISVTDHKFYKYGLVFASIALILAFVGWVIAYFVEEQSLNLIFLNYVLFLWNFVGACFMTFGGPFEHTGNGYFASWGLALFATLALDGNSGSFRDTARTAGPIMGLFTASVVLIVAISSHGVKSSSSVFDELVYGLIIALLTVLVTAAVLRDVAGLQSAMLPVLAVFTILWMVAAYLLTFNGPFLTTGNGYFGAWGGALAALFGTHAARRSDQN